MTVPDVERDVDYANWFPGEPGARVRKGEEGKPTKIGAFGVLHPEVLKSYDIPFPTSALEMDLEPLM